MRRLMILAMAMFISGQALAGQSEKDRYDMHVERFGGTVEDVNPRAMCLCINDLETNHVGYMIINPGQANSATLHCFIPGFDVDGKRTGSFGCDDFVPLVR